MKLYHGTSLAAYREIRRNGLIPQGSKGADYWALHSPKAAFARFLYGSIPIQPGNVFLTTDKERAYHYAEKAAEVTNSLPVVLAVEPMADLTEDPQDAGGSYCHHGPIPPDLIEPVVRIP